MDLKIEKLKLLFIEDDELDKMAFRRFAKNSPDFNFEYTITSSVKEAKHALNTEKFDIIVSDFDLGDGDAFDIIQKDMDVPFVITTGSGNEEIAVKAMKLGAYDYIIKDIDGHYFKMIPNTVTNAIIRFNSEKELKKYQENLEILVAERTVELEKEISVRKKAEEELKTYRDHLKELVKQRTAELEGKNEDLERMNQLFVGRELRIKELKDKLKAYEAHYGKEIK